MGALQALIALGSGLSDDISNLPVREKAKLLLESGRLGSLDYEQAIQWEERLGPFPSALRGAPTQSVLREILKILIVSEPPIWSKAFVQGRRTVIRTATEDEIQCLITAGLFEPTLTEDSVAWWDSLAHHFRSEQDRVLHKRGREGERLSFALEKHRLAGSGREDLSPHWISIDDETLGYDIQSFSLLPRVRKTYIECKATLFRPLQFYVTRNEWRVASSHREDYVFHIWHLPSETLTIMSPEELDSSIPSDKGDGEWQEVRVTVSGGIGDRGD